MLTPSQMSDPATNPHVNETTETNIDFAILAALLVTIHGALGRRMDDILDQTLRMESLSRHNAGLVDRDVHHAAEHASLVKRVTKLQGKGGLRQFGRKILGLFRRRNNDDVCSSY